MPSNNDTTTKFKVDISELKSAMQEAKRQINVTNSEFKAISSSMDNWAKSSDGISAKLSQLDNNLKSQKTILSTLERQYELTVAQMGEGSAEADRLKIAINNQKAVINGTEKEISKFNSQLKNVSVAEEIAARDGISVSEALEQMARDAKEASKEIDNVEDEVSDASKSLKDLEKDTKNSSDGFTVFKGVLANLATQGINLLIDGVKAAGEAMVGLVKDSVMAYGEAEQLRGGIETLFGTGGQTIEEYAKSVGKSVDEVKDKYSDLESAQDVMFKNANDAYKTAGMTANEYMETVTGFSASLISSMGGDTLKASEIANMAIIDMSDNANKMGTSMEGIQNAYAGFAKQNYTMLDNLSLGYGGTQAEMERLLKDAEKLSGVKYDISNLSDVYSAIHVIQEQMGIAGTTAKEASATISGSVGMMKSAWGNLLAGMADENADFEQLVTNLVDSVTTMLGNVMPRVIQAISGIGELITSLAPIIASELPKLIDEVLPTLLTALGSLFEAVLSALITSLPRIIRTVLDFIPSIIDGILGAIPDVLNAVINMVYTIIDGLAMMTPDLLKSAIKFFTTIVKALPKIADNILDSFLAIVDDLIYGLLNSAPELLDSALEFFNAIIEAIPLIIENLVWYLPFILEAIVDFLVQSVPQLLNAVISLFNTIVQAIPLMLPVLIQALPTIINAIISGLFTFLPVLLSAAIQLFMAIVNAIPTIVQNLASALPQIINTITTTLLNNMPLILDTATQVLMAIVEAIPIIVESLAGALPQIIVAVMSVMGNLLTSLSDFVAGLLVALGTWIVGLVQKAGEGAENFINTVIDWVKTLPSSVGTWLSNVISKVITWGTNLAAKGKTAATSLFNAIVNTIKTLPDKIKQIGSDMVKGLWEGIKDMKKWIIDKVKGFGDDVLNGLKDFFGIHSPSRLMRDEIGKWIPEGIAVGIDENAKSVLDSMRNLTTDAVIGARDGFTTGTTGEVTGGLAGGVVNNYTQNIYSPKQLDRLDIYRQSKNLLGYAGGAF